MTGFDRTTLKRFLLLIASNDPVITALRLLNRDKLRIIYYHRVVGPKSLLNPVEPGMFVDQDAFDEQIRFLKEQYTPVSEAQVISALNGEAPIPANAVWVTFDDGYKDNFTLGCPILKKYSVPATFFVTSGYVNSSYYPAGYQPDQDAFMTWDDIRSLSGDGFAIGAHTVSHPSARQLTKEALDEEVSASKSEIEQNIKMTVRSFAYPFGKKVHVDPNIGTPVLKRNRIEVAVTTIGGANNDLRGRRFGLRRFGASYFDSIEVFRLKVAVSGFWQI